MYQLRIQADITQQRLEDLTGVHFSTWSRFESGARSRPQTHHITLFVNALGLSQEIHDELLALSQLPHGKPRRKYTATADKVQQMLDRAPADPRQIKFLAP